MASSTGILPINFSLSPSNMNDSEPSLDPTGAPTPATPLAQPQASTGSAQPNWERSAIEKWMDASLAEQRSTRRWKYGLRTAWLIDKHKDYNLVRKDIAAIKVAMPKVYNDIATKAAHLHGALGVSNEMPFMHMVTSSLVMGIADGPTEVHKVTLAKQVLKDYRPDNDLFPKYHIPRLQEAAKEQFATELEELRADYARQAAAKV